MLALLVRQDFVTCHHGSVPPAAMAAPAFVTVRQNSTNVTDISQFAPDAIRLPNEAAVSWRHETFIFRPQGVQCSIRVLHWAE